MRSSNYTEIIDWLEEAAALASRSKDVKGVQSQIDLFWRFVASLHSTRTVGQPLGEDERLSIQEAQVRLTPFVWWLDKKLEEQKLEEEQLKIESAVTAEK